MHKHYRNVLEKEAQSRFVAGHVSPVKPFLASERPEETFGRQRNGLPCERGSAVRVRDLGIYPDLPAPME